MFRARCASCHGFEGLGSETGPALARNGMLRSRADWSLYRTISRGIPGTAMRGHDLAPRAIWQLVTYVRSLVIESAVLAGGRSVNVTPEHLRAASSDPSGWYTYSGDYRSQRFSRLTEIDTRSVSRLRVAWQYQSPSTENVVETTPLVVNGTIFLTEPPASVVALNAADGKVLWRYARLVPDGVSLCCGAVNRGVAILDSLVYFGTLDARLVALNARTGRVVWDRPVADWQAGYSITGAPLAVNDLIITGVGGGEYGIRGFITAFDAKTGEQRWRFWTVPAPSEPGSETWSGDSWKRGGAPSWLTGSYDPELNLVYWGIGNPGPNFNGDERAGDNLYSNSVVALDAKSGALQWHFQFTPHDEHDWDAVQVPVLVDAQIGNERRALMAWANRNAFYYLLDRRTGKFILARPFAKQTWAAGMDSAGRPKTLESSRPTKMGSRVYPSVAGATNWWSPAYSPRTGLMYVPTLEGSALVFRDPPRFLRNEMFLGSASQPSAEVQTSVRAIDVLTGEVRWDHALTTRMEWHRLGGILAVAGDVIFIGDDDVFYALDARTGAELWHFNTGGRIAAAPVTYTVNGQQFVALAAGRSLIAFTLEREGAQQRPLRRGGP